MIIQAQSIAPQRDFNCPNLAPVIWDATGSRNGTRCFNIPTTIIVVEPLVYPDFVKADINALSFMNDDAHSLDNGGGGISFAVWINADMNPKGMLNTWAWLFIYRLRLETNRRSPLPDKYTCGQHYDIHRLHLLGLFPTFLNAYVQANLPLINYGGRWNHFAFVKEPDRVTIYSNGNAVTQWTTADYHPAVHGPLFTRLRRMVSV